MIEYADVARQHVRELLAHYREKGRLEAVENLFSSLLRAERRIEDTPEQGMLAPRPYPRLARPDRLWVQPGAYWMQYRSTIPPVITGVYSARSDIPGRVRPET